MKTKPDVVVLGEELMADSANTSKVKGSCNHAYPVSAQPY